MEIGQALGNILDGLENVFNKLGLVTDVYKENTNGEYALVDSKELGDLKRSIAEVKSILLNLEKDLNAASKDIIKAINDDLDKVIESIEKDKLDVKVVTDILSKTITSIKKNPHLDISQLKQEKRGGKFASVSMDGKKVGGIIVDKNNTNNIQTGTYTELDKVLKLLQFAVSQIQNSTKEQVNEADVEKIVREHLDGLAKNCAAAAEKLPTITRAKRVKKAKSKEGLFKTLTVTLTVVLLLSNVGRGQDYTVAVNDQPQYETTVEQDAEDAIADVEDSIEVEYGNFVSAGDEAKEVENQDALDTLGITEDMVGSEIAARDNKLDRVAELEKLTKQLHSLQDTYKNVKNPSNLQWIHYQTSLNRIYEKILLLGINTENKTNEYLELWNQLNEEHIEIGLKPEAEKAHMLENENNTDAIEINAKQVEKMQEKVDEVHSKIAFYDMLYSIPNINEVKNIEDVSETFYKLSQKIGQDKVETLLKSGNINLLAAYLKIPEVSTMSPENFTGVLALMQNTFDIYVEEHCDGDTKQVNEEKYAQYFCDALGLEERIGETGLIRTLGAMLDQNNLNSNFYRDYGSKDTVAKKEDTRWAKVIRTVRTFFDGSRRSEYVDLIEGLEAIGFERDNIEIGGR